MKLQIKYSPKKLIEIEVDPTASIVGLMQQIYQHDEEAHDNLIALDDYAASTLLLLCESQWLEKDKYLSDYNVSPGQIISLISLRFSAGSEPTASHIPEEFFCQLSGKVFYEPLYLPSGVSAEKDYIYNWLGTHTDCPFTRTSLNLGDLSENKSIKEKLTRLTERYPILGNIVHTSQYQKSSLFSEQRMIVASQNDRSLQVVTTDIDGLATIWRYSRDRQSPSYILRGTRSLLNDNLSSRVDQLMMIQQAMLHIHQSIPMQIAINNIFNLIIADAAFNLSENHLNVISSIFFSPEAHYYRRTRAHSLQCIQETINALIHDEYYGVTIDLIHQHWRPHSSRPAWMDSHKLTLIYLVTGNCSEDDPEQLPPLPAECCLEVTHALKKMSGLHDGYALLALKRLHRYGLTGAHLREWRSDEGSDLLQEDHYNALIFLVEEQKIPPVDAIRQIDRESAADAACIASMWAHCAF